MQKEKVQKAKDEIGERIGPKITENNEKSASLCNSSLHNSNTGSHRAGRNWRGGEGGGGGGSRSDSLPSCFDSVVTLRRVAYPCLKARKARCLRNTEGRAMQRKQG